MHLRSKSDELKKIFGDVNESPYFPGKLAQKLKLLQPEDASEIVITD
ncbi:hypothetical protein RISK_006506 [Rhodopirellula islandica]|uniref:Uncharacterized protein n=1 Tax=Rhodopirellula islandica TaxID=595434 RepID=A0A0J1B371_RHOIS|nr:hypothetical protein [Rhodopirellula islandica]KLU01350.1 hypothetical protein RISK_006506 [Rhodopirellula islandica]